MNVAAKTNGKAGFLGRAFSNLRNAWQGIGGTAYDETAANLQPDLPEEDARRLTEQMHACLETRGGEVSARARAAALGRAYLALNETGRERFLKVMTTEFDVDRDKVDAAIDQVQTADNGPAREQAERHLRSVLEPL